MFVCRYLGYISTLHMHPCSHARFPCSKSRNFYPNYRVCWPLPPLVVFRLDVQSSSCPKPPDPLTWPVPLPLCHCKQEAGDSGGGGARSGSQTCLTGSLEENKHGGEFSFFTFSVLQRSPGIYWDKGFCIERRICSRSSEWLKQPQAERYL